MSQDFKLKFDEMRDNQPKKNEAGQDAFLATPGHVRNLCFVWPDGKMKFWNYAYLVSGEYFPDESCINLIFTSDIVNIKGYRLNELFVELLNHVPKTIICNNQRYSSTDDNSYTVTEIEVTKN